MTQQTLSRFEIHDTFLLESRRWYVVSGRIMEGVFQKGQVGYFEHHPQLTFCIHAIEFILPKTQSHAEHPALVFSNLSDAQFNLLQNLPPSSCFLVSSPLAESNASIHQS